MIVAENKTLIRPLGGETLVFDGLSQYRTIPSSDAINFGTWQDFTVLARIYADPVQPRPINDDADVIEKWDWHGGYPFVIRYMARGPQQGQLTAARYDGKNNPALGSKTRLNDRKFHHVAFVRRTDRGKPTLELYIDGKLEATTPDTTSGNTQNNSLLYLGCRGSGTGTGTGGTNFFAGQVRDLELHNQALPADEIARQSASKPNILFIIADDLGVDALRITGRQVIAQVDGPSGARAPAPLPVLGKLLQSGIHFAHAWAQPVCSPTRASLFTGLHAWKTEVGFPGINPLPSNEVTTSGARGAPLPMLAKVLKDKAGYRCGMFGKWDLGGGEGLGGQTPLEWGWDHFEGIYGGGMRPMAGPYGLQLNQLAAVSLQATNRVNLERLRQTQDPATKPSRDAVVAQCKAYLEKVCDPRFVEGQPDVRYYIWPKNIDDLATNTKIEDVAPFKRTHLYATADNVASARAWIKQSSGQPWCVALTLLAPHDPYHVPPRESYTIKLPDDPSPQQMFIAMIESMDFYIGQLLNAPELQDELKNTVIVFVGDNGTQDRDPDTGVQIDGIRGDDKTSYHIGAVHVPMIVADGGLYLNGPPCYLKDAWGKPTAGGRCEGVVHIMDLYKTALDIAAATAPGETDSVSMKGHLQKAEGARRYIFSQQYPTAAPDLVGVGKHASVSDGTYKLSCYRSKFINGGTSDEFTYELCKLVPDPSIPGSFAAEPLDLDDPKHLPKLRELHGELQKQRLDSGDSNPVRAPLPFPRLPAPLCRYVRLVARSEVNGGPWTSAADFQVLVDGKPLDRSAWTVTSDSQELGAGNFSGNNAIDGSLASMWHTQWVGQTPRHPHWLSVDLQSPQRVSGFKYLPRQDMPNGRIAEYDFQISHDGKTWSTVASGRFPDGTAERTVSIGRP
jgi:arylsulfatase A-like enzyme